ncbi:pentapeptide repeat-containing protein [Actinokineospora auranticolor]
MFRGAEFLDTADFHRTRFDSVHRFRDSTFRAKARFDHAVFHGDADLDGAHIAEANRSGTSRGARPSTTSRSKVAI